MATITKHALRVYSSLAALKGDGDVLDALIPFFEPILRVMDGKLFEPRHLAIGAQKMYHWRITREIAEQFVPRLVHKGYLRRIVSDGKEAAYGVTFSKQSEEDSSDDIQPIFEEIITAFSNFPPLLTDLLHFKKSREELADILMRFLVSSDVFAQAVTISPPESGEEMLLASKIEEGGRPLKDDERYLAARFVQDLAKSRPDLFQHVARLSSIGLLTEVVDDFVRPTNAADKSDLIIVLDAPLALDYLGLSGNAIKDDVRSVFDALRKIGCKIVVFPTTCTEMSRNLRSMLALEPSKRHGYTHQAMLRNEVMADFVKLVAGRPEDALKGVGIEVRSMGLDSFPNMQKFFSADLYEDFFASIHWVTDVAPREHDATCLALLMRLREGKHSSDIFRSRYVFATRNSAFARKSREYCIKSHLLHENQEGPVIHQREFATVAWLRTGLGSDGTIPRSHLIGHCDRVLRVRPEVASAIRSRLAEVTPDKLEQFDLLLLDHRSLRKMADATLNDESVVTGDNAEELLEMMRKATAADIERDYSEKMAALETKHRKQRREWRDAHDGEMAEIGQQVKQLQEEVSALSSERNQLASDRRSVEGGVIERVNRNLLVLRLLISIPLVILGAGFILNLFTGTLGEQNKFWHYALAVVGAYGIYDMVASLLHWRSWGLTHVLNAAGRRLLKGELSRRGVNWLTPKDFVISGGVVSEAAPGASEG